jgi:hypothetical protein
VSHNNASSYGSRLKAGTTIELKLFET